jgi:uridine kinase
MKGRLQGHLAPLAREFESNPEREDALERALRVLAMFDEIPAVTDESLVPPHSLLREFIGGSAYTYH